MCNAVLPPTLSIILDDNPTSPREWSNLSVLVTLPRFKCYGEDSTSDLAQYVADLPEGSIWIPAVFTDGRVHIGSVCGEIDLSDNAVFVVTPDAIHKEYSCERISHKIRENAEKCLQSEAKCMDLWAKGEVWGFVTEDNDSCWGFLGDTAEFCGIADNFKGTPYESLVAKAWEGRGTRKDHTPAVWGA